MLKVARQLTIACPPEEFLEFVMDPRRYTAVDDKIGKISWVRREGNVTQFKFRPKLPGMALPEPKAVSTMRLTPGRRVDVELRKRPQNTLQRWVATFRASFACEPAPEGVRVTRTVSFDFNPLVRWMFEPVLRRTLPVSLERELRLAQDVLETR